MNFLNDFKNVPFSSRPRAFWWLPSTLVDEREIEREIKMLKDAGFAGVEIIPSPAVLNPKTNRKEKGWNSREWTETVRKILKIAKALDFELDILVLGSLNAYEVIKDVDDPLQGARLELDGAHVDGITKEKPYRGALPLNQEAVEDAKAVNGTCKLYAVTVAKYVDKEKRVLSFESARELNVATEVVKTGDEPLSYYVEFTPEDDGEYVLFAWWRHPSDQTACGVPQQDFWGEYGTKKLLEYHKNFLDDLGEEGKYIGSYFSDSLEWNSHLPFTVGFREAFVKKRGFDITKYLPALYEQYFWGWCRAPRPDFSFDAHSERLINDYGEFLTDCYIENHLIPLKEFCNRRGITLRCQNAYGQFLEMERTAGVVDIPETETLYGGDILDFYRAQAGAVHITGKRLYSIEASAEKPNRGNGEINSGLFIQGIKRQLWHLQRAYSVGVNQVYFHGCPYRGDYYGEGNENGVLPGVHWPGFSPMGFIGEWSEIWDDRQPIWLAMRQVTDCLGRVQNVLQKGRQVVDLAIYRHSYQEVIDTCRAEKLLKTSALEQRGYSYDFLSPSHFIDFDTDYDGEGIYSDGPCYKALIFNEQRDLPLPTLKKVISLIDQGLPVVFCGCIPYDGAFFGESRILEKIREISSRDNVRVCQNLEELPTVLKELNVLPRVAYREVSKALNAYRKADEADYVYLYHYADADKYLELNKAKKETFTLDLRVDGIPYALDPWTGNVKKMEVVERTSERTSINVALAPNDCVVIALIKDENQARAIVVEEEKRVEADRAFELKNWTLEVESWTEGARAVENRKEIVKTVVLEQPVYFTKLDGLERISGVGYYHAEFTSEKGWEDGVGAYLQASEIENAYTIEVNGEAIPADQIDPLVDIGRYLKRGKNEIKISVYSTLLNAALAYSERNGFYNGFEFKDYGMNGLVKIIPYVRKFV